MNYDNDQEMQQLIQLISNDMKDGKTKKYHYGNYQYTVFTYPDNIDEPKNFYCDKVELSEDRSINEICIEIKDYINNKLSHHPKYGKPKFKSR